MSVWRVGGSVVAGTYVGRFEALTAQEAIEKAKKQASVSVCHQCSEDISDPEIESFWAESEETGETFDEREPLRVSAEMTQWTTEPPTKPGWYWAFDTRDKRCVMLEVWSWSGEVCYCFVHDNGSTTEIESHGAYQWQDFSHFMRIEPPEVPE